MFSVLKKLAAKKKKAPTAFSGTGVVLMVDTRGIAELSECLSPEGLIERLNVNTSKLIDAVEKNGGIVFYYVGGILVAYWSPVQMPGAIESAMVAALRAVSECGTGVAVGVAVGGLAFSSESVRPILVGSAYSRAESSLRLASPAAVAVDSSTFEVLSEDLRSRFVRKESHFELT